MKQSNRTQLCLKRREIIASNKCHEATFLEQSLNIVVIKYPSCSYIRGFVLERHGFFLFENLFQKSQVRNKHSSAPPFSRDDKSEKVGKAGPDAMAVTSELVYTHTVKQKPGSQSCSLSYKDPAQSFSQFLSDCLEGRHPVNSLIVPHSPTILTGRLHLGHVVSQRTHRRDSENICPQSISQSFCVSQIFLVGSHSGQLIEIHVF